MKTHRVVIIGAGGLGTSAVWGIAAAWQAESRLEIHLYDPESVERSNLHRQVLYSTSEVGEPKAALLAAHIAESVNNPYVSFIPHAEAVGSENIAQICQTADFVIEASDSVAAKFLVNDFCTTHGIAFCYAGAVGVRGLLWFHSPESNSQACLRCLFGSFTSEELAAQSATCAEAGVFGPVPGYFGFLQANVLVRYLSGEDLSSFQGYRFQSHGPTQTSPIVRWRAAEFRCRPAEDCQLGCGARR